MDHCVSCVTRWVDRACSTADVRLTDLDRRRLIAALLSRRHLILSGPAGIGKERLIRALALSIVNGEQSRLCLLQGHPWWAARTADIGRFVELQTDFSLWRLAHFVEAVLNRKLSSSQNLTDPDRDLQVNGVNNNYVACVERISPVEIELYFRVVSEWLLKNARGNVNCATIRLMGTYDSLAPVDLDDRILRVVALVHLSGAQHGDAQSQAARGIDNVGQHSPIGGLRRYGPGDKPATSVSLDAR